MYVRIISMSVLCVGAGPCDGPFPRPRSPKKRLKIYNLNNYFELERNHSLTRRFPTFCPRRNP
jgi:hypothetical protein